VLIRQTFITFLSALLVIAMGGGLCSGQVLTSGELLINGIRLEISPVTQEIDPGRPTVVYTALGGVTAGDMPSGFRVEGELSGPGLDGPLHLSTVPGEPFRIPGLNREGTFRLSGIRLTNGDEILLEAEPNSVEILVHRLVIASVSSRPLSPEEIEAFGIVIGENNYTAWHYTVAFQLESGLVEIPFDVLVGPDGLVPLELPGAAFDPLPNLNTEGPIPTVFIGTLTTLEGEESPEEEDELGAAGATVPGFLVFPTDIAFLNQFFSAILVVQNGALADSGIELRNLSAVLELADDGIRQAETQPPTIPGEPVTIMDSGPDGEVGTADDLTFIVAQSTGEASWLIEGLEEGQHRVTAHMTGELHGLAGGEPALLEGSIPGIVVVRDPRFSMTFFHPWTVRAGEHYQFRVVVANTSTTPVYDFSMTLPGNTVSGAQVLGDETQSVPELLPGQSAMVSWDMLALETGRVIASGFNTSNAIEASFRFEMGVGELGIPLSPESLVLPSVVGRLPETFVEKSLELLGLAYSLATAPNGAEVDLPPVGEMIVKIRGAEMATAARRLAFGESLERSMIGLGFKWLGSEVWSRGWDSLRRASRRGYELEAFTAAAISDYIGNVGQETAFSDLEEVLITGRPTMVVYAEGAGFDAAARLRVTGHESGKAAIAQASDTALFLRDLPGGAVLEIDGGGWSGEIAVVAVPLDDEGQWIEGGYRVELLGADSGEVTLEAVIVMPDGTTRRVRPSMAVATADGSLALVDIGPEVGQTTVEVDLDGDGLVDASETVTVDVVQAPAPRMISVTFDPSLNPPEGGPYDDLILLLSQNVDLLAISDLNVGDWVMTSHLELATSDGGVMVSDRERRGAVLARQADPAFLVVSVNAPLNPHAEMSLSTGASPIPVLGGRTLNLNGHSILNGGDLSTGGVRGVVIDPQGEVVPAAQVFLYENAEICLSTNCRWVPVLSDHVTADSNGAFSLDAVRFRSGQIPARYGAFIIRAIDPASGHEAILRGTLSGDGAVRDVTVFMVGRGDIVGTLRRADGQALTEPEIFGRSVTNPEEYATTVPDASGVFRLTDLPVGAIQVLGIDGQDYVYATAVIPGPGQEGSVDLVLPETSRPMAQVTGSVTDGETATAAVGVQVYLVPSGSGAATHVATTDEDGRWAMTDVPSGLVTFKAWDPQRGAWVASVAFELVGDAGNEVDIVTTQVVTGSVVGTVYRLATGLRTPLPDARVISDSHGRWTITDQDGHYRLDDMVLGSVSLRAVDQSNGSSARRTVELISEGQELIIDLDIKSGAASGAIRVLVNDRSGAPVGGVNVTADYFGSGLEGTTDANGLVLIEGVSSGVYGLIARRGARLGIGKATVHFDGYLAEAVITLGGTVSLSVETLADTSGGETVRVLATVGYRRPGISDSGHLTILPESGEFPCELDDEQICHIENLPEGVGNLVVAARNGFYGETSLSEPLDPSDEGRLLTLNFSAPGTIAGRVVTESEGVTVPVEGAWVQLWVSTENGGSVPQQTVTTLADGAFSFDLIPPGAFGVRVYSPSINGIARISGYISSAQEIEDLELTVRPPGAVQGAVAVCNGGGGAGEVVQVTLESTGTPRPFIDGQTIPQLDSKHLELTLDENGQAGFMFTELILGTWNVRVTSAVNGSAWRSVSISEPGAVLNLADPLCLRPTGSIEGHVYSSETGLGAPSVQVQLFRERYFGSELYADETTDENGYYRFGEIPVGSTYLTRAFDAGVNRGGASTEAALCSEGDPGFGDSCVQDAVLDINLAGLGRIEGLVLQADGTPVINATIRLQTMVVVNAAGELVQVGREYLGFSGQNGGYGFDGIPQGTIVIKAFDPDSHLFVEHQIVLDPGGDPITTLNLVMPETQSVTIQVLEPSGQPVGEGPAAVAYRQSSPDFFGEPYGGGRTVAHLAGRQPAIIDGVVSGRYETAACIGGCSAYDVAAVLSQNFGTALGGVWKGTMPTPPEDQIVEIRLMGRADLDLRVTQGGVPVEGAEVRFDGEGHYGQRTFISQSLADGTIGTIPLVGVGEYTASATLTDQSGNALGGAVSFSVEQGDHGTLLQFDIPLELAGSVDGSIVDSQGLPVQGALVIISRPGRTFRTISASDGVFVFGALPEATDYSISVFASIGAGRYTDSAIGVSVDEVTHLGALMLDETNPTVTALSPANGEQGVDVDTTIVLEFSEAMRHATLTSSRLRLRSEGGGDSIPTALAIEDVSSGASVVTRVTMTPPILAGETLYVVDVLQGVADLGGRTLTFDAHQTFRTRDTQAPTVVLIVPPHDPAGVSPVLPEVQPVISFSEPIDAASIGAQQIRLLDDGGNPIDAGLTVERDGFDVRIQPLSMLALDILYTIEISGVTDASGNPMTAPVSSTFRVRDDQAPTVVLVTPVGANADGDVWSAVEGVSLTLRALVTSNDAVAGVTFSIDGTGLGTGVFDSGSGEYRLAMTAPVQPGPIAVSAVASDVSGNISTVATHVLNIVDDRAPTGVLSVLPSVEILPNHLLQVTIDAADDFGLAHAFLAISGAMDESLTLDLSGLSDQVSTSLRVPSIATAGAQIIVSVEIEDSLGQRTVLAPEVLTVLADTIAPVIGADEPAAGAEYSSGETVSFVFTLEDEVAITSTDLVVGGESVAVTLGSPQEPGTSWTATATASWIAQEVQSVETIDWTVTAVDPAGNSGELTGQIVIRPLVVAGAPVVTFVCPRDGDHVLAGVAQTVAFEITDPDEGELIQSYTVTIDGVPIAEDVPVNQTEFSGSFDWTPPADALPDQPFVLVIEARDYSGIDGSATITERLAGGTILSGSQIIGAEVDGQDLVLTAGTFTVSEALSPNSLTVLKEAVVTTDPGVGLRLTVVDAVRVECGGSIDVTGKGYGQSQTYGDSGISNDGYAGGSHLGQGGYSSGSDHIAAGTFGSVYRPQEKGGGGHASGGLPGGGVVSIRGASLELHGVIAADGQSSTTSFQKGGAGGSVWLRIDGGVTGDGVIRANGTTAYWGERGSGGGGAISIEHGNSSGDLGGVTLDAKGGANARSGGAGTVYLKGPTSTYGDLMIDNGGISGRETVLPSLGGGAAGADSAGTTLVTGPDTIQQYFVGHWVEIYEPRPDGTQGDLKGTWRIKAITDGTITLEPNADDGDPSVIEGDLWQGVYLFDSVTMGGQAEVVSADPIRTTDAVIGAGTASNQWTNVKSPIDVEGEVRIVGRVNAVEIEAGSLQVEDGGVLSHRSNGSLRIDVAGAVVIDGGGSIDVTGKGYGQSQTYGDSGISNDGYAGGSHLGQGGYSSGSDHIAAGTFGSVYRPQEKGGGGHASGGLPGGGVVSIRGASLELHGVIAADGQSSTTSFQKGGAGGSVWLRIDGGVTGDGVIRANGTTAYWGERGSGGGGAISIEHGNSSGDLGGVTLDAKGGANARSGGAGTVYLKGPTSTYGDLMIDNGGISGRETVLPSLGGGAAGADSAGTTLVTGPDTIQQYFVGHWVEIYEPRPDGTQGDLKGTWRIKAITDGTITLEPNADDGDPSVIEGDLWRGLYRFDSVTIGGNAHVVFGDVEEIVGTLDVETGSSVAFANHGGPDIDSGLISMTAIDGVYAISGTSGAITDSDGIASAVVVNETTAQSWALAVAADGSFPSVAVTGTAGDFLRIDAQDNHAQPLTSSVVVGSLPVVPPSAVNLSVSAISVDEFVASVTLVVTIDPIPFGTVGVDIATLDGSATAGEDFQSVATTLTFDAANLSRQLAITLSDDALAEGDETFTVVLSNPDGCTLGALSEATVTILDNEGSAPRELAYSVRPGGGDLLGSSVGFDLAGGHAVFDQALPPAIGRGDIVVSDQGSFLIETCQHDFACDLITLDGVIPNDFDGATATAVNPAFTSLSDAVDPAQALFGGSGLGLSGANARLELACYGPTADTTPVSISGWGTDSGRRLTIRSAQAGDDRSGGSRHEGHWDASAYRLETTNVDALTIDGEYVDLEGLQIYSGGESANPLKGVVIYGAADLSISETLIRLTGDGTTERIAVDVIGPAAVDVHNCVLWDLGDGAIEAHAGILNEGGGTLFVANSTIVGGAYGIRNLSGQATEINTLVTGAVIACFDGPFSASSGRNLSSDESAPRPPEHHTGTVVVANPDAGANGDFHLGCGVLDRIVSISSSLNVGESGYEPLFDGKVETLLAGDGVDPAFVELAFDQGVVITGAALRVSDCDQHQWRLLSGDGGNPEAFEELIPWTTIDNPSRGWGRVELAAPTGVRRLRLEVFNSCTLGEEGQAVFLHEFELEGLNPACDSGLDLSADAEHPFGTDLDAVARSGAWDIGADQHRETTLGFARSTSLEWWESEGEARLQVVLSEPVTTPVSVSYRTINNSNASEDDFVAVAGRLKILPGEVSKTIVVPLIDDGFDDDGEAFVLVLEDLVGAAWSSHGGSRSITLTLHDAGTPPIRTQLTQTLISVTEGGAPAQLGVELSAPITAAGQLTFDALDGTARIALDFVEPRPALDFAIDQQNGVLNLGAIDDDRVETPETYRIVPISFPSGVAAGAPSEAVVQILDNDQPRVVLTTGAVTTGEGDAAMIAVTVRLEGDPGADVTVDLGVVAGTAEEGSDYHVELTSNPVTVTLNALEPEVVIDVARILNDGDPENDETFNVVMSNAQGVALGSPATSVVTIVDDGDGIFASFSDASYETWESGQFKYIRLTLSGDPSVSPSVDYSFVGGSASEGQDYSMGYGENGTVTFERRDSWWSGGIFLNIYDDDITEGDETVIIELSNPQGCELGTPVQATLTIHDPTLFIDSDSIDLMMDDCGPVLEGSAGAVTAANGQPISVEVSGWRRTGGGSITRVWDSDELTDVDSGGSFAIALPQLDLEEIINIEISQGVGNRAYEFLFDLTVEGPPSIGWLDTEYDEEFMLMLDEGSILDRLGTVTLSLHNTVSDLWVSIDDPCLSGGMSEASIAAEPDDEIELEACHGVESVECTTESIGGGAGGPIVVSTEADNHQETE
jgi:hypothetical protein